MFGPADVFKTSIGLASQLFGGKIASFLFQKGLSIDLSKITSIYNLDTIKFSQVVACIFGRTQQKDGIYQN